MHQTNFRRLLLQAFLCLMAAPAAAQDAAVSNWSFSGYGTLGYVRDNRDDLGFTRDIGQEPGRRQGGSFAPDSRLGLQAAYRFNPQTEAVAQWVLRDKPDRTLANSIEWAYLAYRPTPDWQVRAGRVGIDVFMLSDYRSLGYAQTTVRPNVDFYGFMPIYALDGADVAYSFEGGGARWQLKAQLGRTRADIPEVDYHFKAQNFLDVTLTREAGPWRLKAGYAQMKVTENIPMGALTPGLATVAGMGLPGVSAEAGHLRDELQFKGGLVSYAALGAGYDDGTWLVQGELARVASDRDVSVKGDAAYVLAGRRFGAWLPYAGLSGFWPAKGVLQGQTNWGALARLQREGLHALNSSRIDQSTTTLGVRWDFHAQAALKLQWDSVRIKDYGYATWTHGMFNDSKRARLVSATVDWVF